ncbi:hypothetical protein ACK12G_36665, partial [Mycolicibacterium wolinskyi]
TDDGTPAGISGAVEFRTDVFDPTTIEQLVTRLERILVAVTADPLRRLSSVELLSEDERERLDAWGNRNAPIMSEVAAKSIPVLFGGQVARCPDAVALVSDGRSVTYRELDEASNR